MVIAVDLAEQIADLEACNQLATEIWGSAAACSVPQMRVHARYGGVVLLARNDGVPVGFLFSFPALFHGEWTLWSHETGILEGYRHCGIGAMLKRAQRRHALQLGYRTISWTFDPLISRNAYFNLRKLGADIADYQVNVYGADPADKVNQGLETDRMIAIWSTSDDAGTGTAAPSETMKATGITLWLDFVDGEPALPSTRATGSDVTPVHLMRIPLDYEQMVQTDKERAIRWRMAFRNAAQQLIARGYRPDTMEVGEHYATYRWEMR